MPIAVSTARNLMIERRVAKSVIDNGYHCLGRRWLIGRLPVTGSGGVESIQDFERYIVRVAVPAE